MECELPIIGAAFLGILAGFLLAKVFLEIDKNKNKLGKE